jgi:hypothetical protein
MRQPTVQELVRWNAVAREHGAVDEEGRPVFGRVELEDWDKGPDVWRMFYGVITPLIADEYTEVLKRKTPPILFGRTASGEVILPGRWWRRMSERMSEDDRPSDEYRRQAARFAREADVGDVLLPAATDTIEVGVLDDTGQLVPHEALPPEMRVTVCVRRPAADVGN